MLGGLVDQRLEWMALTIFRERATMLKTWGIPPLVAILVAAQPTSASRRPSHERQCAADDLEEIVGYLAVTASNVAGDFEGADFDKTVKLDNGMIFEFQEYKYSYSYRPRVIVFATSVTVATGKVAVYKLLIDDELYDVTRVR